MLFVLSKSNSVVKLILVRTKEDVLDHSIEKLVFFIVNDCDFRADGKYG